MSSFVAEKPFGEVEVSRATSDLIERLRRWSFAVDARPASDLMDEAAAELERLLVVIDCYAQSSAAGCREINGLREQLASRDATKPTHQIGDLRTGLSCKADESVPA